MLKTYLFVAGANFLFIFLKAFQQRNVAFDNYKMVVPTSFGLALTEVYVIAKVAVLGFTLPLALTIGAAAGTGALSAMLLHKRYHMKPTKNEVNTCDDEEHEHLLSGKGTDLGSRNTSQILQPRTELPSVRGTLEPLRAGPHLSTNHRIVS